MPHSGRESALQRSGTQPSTPRPGTRPAALAAPLPPPAVMDTLYPCAMALSRQPQRFLTLLHHHLDALVPGGISHLPDRGRPVCERTTWAMLAAVTDERSLAQARPLLEQAGVDNFRDGFVDDQYLTVGHALLRAVHEAYPGEWSTALGSAWIAYFVWVRTHLLIGGTAAEELHREQEASPEPSVPAAHAEPAPVEGETPRHGGVAYEWLMAAMTLDSGRRAGRARRGGHLFPAGIRSGSGGRGPV